MIYKKIPRWQYDLECMGITIYTPLKPRNPISAPAPTSTPAPAPAPITIPTPAPKYFYKIIIPPEFGVTNKE
ncbi:MAG: hypothetical protein ACFFFC_00870 [Candidatus Thorarchaeota archaeon]